VRGNKEAIHDAQYLVDFQDRQEAVANSRPPYNSTVQLESSNFIELQDDEDDEETNPNEMVKIEDRDVPLNFRLLQSADDEESDDDDETDPNEMVKIEDRDVPLNFRFVHYENEDGELIQMQGVY